MASKVSGIVEQIQLGLDGAPRAIASTAYGYCETAAGTAIKNVDMTGFTLNEGITVHIKFANANSASNPKLKFNNEADANAKPIVQYGTTAAGTTSETNGWYAGAVLTLTYDGASWVRDQGFNSAGITSVTIGATSPVQSSTSTAQTSSSASTTISLKDAYGDTKNPYGNKNANTILAGPSSGTAAAPNFRKLVAEDIPDLGTTYVKKSSELLTTNLFAPVSLRGPYISKIDNAFYAANKRWSITATNLSSGSVSELFDGNYETQARISGTSSSVITMDFDPAHQNIAEKNKYFPGYPYGYILISFYSPAGPAAISGRVYCNYQSQGIGWHELTFTPVSDNTTTNIVYRSAHQGYYNMAVLEITIYGNTGNSYGCTAITQIEMHLDRPNSKLTPFLSKYGDETLYYNLTAPKFIGALEGVADKSKAANLTTTTNAITYYTNTTGTFGSKATANGALYATSTNGALQWGTLPIAQGGTGKTSAAEAWTALGGGASGKHDDNYFAKASHNHAASDINSGILDTARIPNLSWNKITSDKPTTVSGYGITDAKTLQSNITDPTVPTTGTNEADAFIDTISQNTNGEISATKKYIPVKNVFIPNTTDTNESIVTDRQAFIPYGNTSHYGVVKVNELNSSTTIPLYIDTSGVLKKCSMYAGGTKVTLNGADKGANTINIYAPTLSGNSGELLISSGANTAPIWTENGIFSSNTWIFSQKLKINPENNDGHSQNLYVHGTAYIDDTTQIGDIIVGSGTSQNMIVTSGNNLDMVLSPTGKLCLYQGGSSGTAKVILNGNTFYPYTDNQVSLGIDGNAWKELYAKTIITTPAGSSTKPIYISSTTKQITESDATVGSQYQPVYLSSGTITAAYPVQYLSWTFANANDNQVVFSNSLFTASTYVLSIVVTSGESNLNGPITWTSGAGTLTLSTSPVTGVVSGYILISFGADLSSTISGTSSHSNT